MKILVACEFSGTVRDAFISRGHHATSCDLIKSTSNKGYHYVGNVKDVLYNGWDMLIAFPPCTYLTVSANRWYYHPDDKHLPVEKRRPHPKYPDRPQRREESVKFVQMLMDAPIDKICIENPIGILSTRIRKPDQIVQPYNFGHDASKSTCLWLKNLDKLKGTEYIEPRLVNGKKRWSNQTYSGQNRLTPSETRGMERSITYKGIAQAMAEQWG